MAKGKNKKTGSISLLPLKKKIGVLLKTGVSRIKFKQGAEKKIFDPSYVSTFSNSLARDLVKEKKTFLTVIPAKRRLYKIFYKKKKLVKEELAERAIRLKEKESLKTNSKKSKSKPTFVKEKIARYQALREKLKIKDIYKDLNSVRYKLKKKLINRKKIHMDKIRNFRSLLSENKKSLDKKPYRKLYLQVKGNLFKTKNALKAQIKNAKKNE